MALILWDIVTNSVGLLPVLMIVLYVFFNHFLKPYFNEKALNLAQKEDVRKITQEIESVKASLTVQSTSQISLIQKRRAAIEFYLLKVEEWVEILCEWPGATSYQEFDEKSVRFNDARIELRKAALQFEIFVDDPELIKQKLEIEKAVRETAWTLKTNQIAILSEIILEIETARSGNNLEAHSEALAKLQPIHVKFNKDIQEALSIFYPQIRDFMSRCKTKIRELY